MVVATSFEVAIINWTVSTVAYTPETFHIEYTKEGSMDREITDTVAMDMINFSAVNVAYSYILEGLEANSTYYFQVIATNSEGVMPSQDLVFTTRDSGMSVLMVVIMWLYGAYITRYTLFPLQMPTIASQHFRYHLVLLYTYFLRF